MPDTDKEILLYEVQFDAAQAQKNAEGFRVELARLKKEKAETENEFKKGLITDQEYGKSIQAIETHLARATAGLKAEADALANDEKIRKSATGSLVQMRANLAAMASQYEKLSQAERENEAVGGKLLKQIDNIEEAEKKRLKGLSDSKKGVSDYIRETNILGVSVGKTLDSFKSGASGIGTFAKAIFSARGALVALTAVPIVLILTAIVSFLTKSKDGMELLERKTAALTAVFNLFVAKIIDIGRGIVKAFTDPVQAVKDLGEAIKQNILNRFLSFGLIVKAIKDGDLRALANAMLQLGTGVTDVVGRTEAMTAEMVAAAKAGEAVAEEYQKITNEERKLVKLRADSRAEFEKQKFIAEDVSKSLSEREAAARKAFAIENNLLQKQEELQERRIANTIKEQGLSEKKGKDYDKLAEEEAKLSDLKAESAAKQTEINNKINDLHKQAQQQEIAGQLAVLNENLRITKERGFQTLEIEKQIIAKQLEYDLVGVIKGSKTEKALRLKYKADLAQAILNDVVAQNERQNKLENDYLQTRLEQEREGSAERLKIEKEFIQQRAFQEEASARILIKDKDLLESALVKIKADKVRDLKAINQQIKDIEVKALDDLLAARLARTEAGSKAENRVQIEQIQKRIADALKDERVGAEEFQRIQAEGFKALGDLNDAYAQQVVDKVVGAVTGITTGLSKLTEAQSAQASRTLDQQQKAALASAGLNADERTRIEEDFAKKKLEIDKESARKKKKIASIENTINTAAAITRAFIDPGGFLGGVFAALALANGLAQQAVIDSQTFAKGGVVNGPSHAGGGVKYRVGNRNVELEGGEAVINKRSTAQFLPLLSSINEWRGNGKAFSGSTTYTPRMAFGGVVSPYQVQGATLSISDIQNIVTATVSRMPRPVVAVADIRSGVRQVSVVESRADIRS
jgi:hypothetical protein